MVEFLRNALGRSGLVSTAATTLAARGAAVACAFAMNVAVARLLGVADSGVFFLSLTIVLAVSVITRFGMDNALIRFVSPEWVEQDYSRVMGICLQGLSTTAGFSLVLSVALFLSAEPMANKVLDNPAYVQILRVLSFAVIPVALLSVVSGILKAINMPAYATFLESGATPMLVVFSVLALFTFGRSGDTKSVASIYLASAALAAVTALVVTVRRIPLAARPRGLPAKTLLGSAYPLVWIAGLNFSIPWSSSLFLEVFSTSESVGLYNAAHRTAGLMAVSLVVVGNIASSRFSVLYAQRKLPELERFAGSAASLTFVIALPAFGALLAFPQWILSMFGEGFMRASSLLVIIATGQFVNVITGPVGYLLMMTGHEALMRRALLLTGLLSLLLNLTLVSRYGALGAAITTAVCLATQNVLAATFAYHRLGICTLPGWATAKTLAARKS